MYYLLFIENYKREKGEGRNRRTGELLKKWLRMKIQKYFQKQKKV